MEIYKPNPRALLIKAPATGHHIYIGAYFMALDNKEVQGGLLPIQFSNHFEIGQKSAVKGRAWLAIAKDIQLHKCKEEEK